MRTIIPILIIVALFSCSVKNNESTDVAEAQDESNSSTPTQLAGTTDINKLSNRSTKLIKTADYYFRVADMKRSTEAIEQTLIKYPAFISSSSLNYVSHNIQNEITVRVQNEYFDELLKEIDKQALLTHYRNVSTSDVSKEFVDLESRLKTKREVEVRYTEILRTKAGKIEELLEAEKQIGALHEEIEATVSRVNFLRDQVSYSTIHLKFYQEMDEQVSQEETLNAQFLGAFTLGLNGVIVVALLLVNLWPLLLLSVAALTVWRFRNRSRPAVNS